MTWEQPFHLADTNHTSNNVSPIVRSESGTVAVIWRGDIRGGGTNLNFGYRLSTNGGIGWNEVEYLLPNDRESLQKHSFSISNSTIFFIFSQIDVGEIQINFTKSTNWGETWSEPAELFRTQETGRLDMGARGDTIYFVWAGRFNWEDKWDIYHIMSTDAGDSWSENANLSTIDGRGSNYPSISINERGDIVVAWIDAKYTDSPFTADIFVRYSYDSGESWSEEEHLTNHHLAKTVRAFWSGDSIHLTWEDWRYDQRDIFYGISTDNGISWGDDQRIEDDPGESRYPDIAVTQSNVHLVWNDFRDDPGYGVYYSRWDDYNPEIPVLSEWGMLLLALLMIADGTVAVLKTRKTVLRAKGR
jgi:hypothetical protein